MVNIIIKRKMAKATGLDNRTLVVRAGEGMLTRNHSNGDFSIETNDERIKTFWDSLNEHRKESIIRKCKGEFKSLIQGIEEEMKK